VKNIVLVRADADLAIGTGHVMRCAALGMRMVARGDIVHFVCAGLPDRLADWFRIHGFGLTVVPQPESVSWQADFDATRRIALHLGNVDLVVVDHYGLDQRWEAEMRQYCRRILVIDDLADRNHDCDLLLDQNLHENAQQRYAGRVPVNAKQFLGPRYALLREEFNRPDLSRARSGSLNRLLIFFGGTDPGAQTLKLISALRDLGDEAPSATIVLGPMNPFRKSVLADAQDLVSVTVIESTDQISALMSEADLAIGTCGISAWERCALGLPCLVTITADNQREDAEILHRLGAIKNLGNAEDVSASDWAREIRLAMGDAAGIQAMSHAAQDVMAGRLEAAAELESALFHA
jgi:UDP-2,4-diacetamido-2,4,6-trideoxy-beta-L-altropyranose hydrolase